MDSIMLCCVRNVWFCVRSCPVVSRVVSGRVRSCLAPGAAWIHGYMWILTNVQYCGYCNTWIPRYCAYHRIAHTCTGPVLRIPDTVLRIPDTHAPSSSTRPRVQPYTAHHSLTSSDPLLQLHTKSAGCCKKCPAPPLSTHQHRACLPKPPHRRNLHVTRSQLDSAFDIRNLLITGHREHFRWQSHPKFRLQHFV